ncbi:ArsR family transcriptional regulator [Desulfuromonas sp. DDH964]|uniref:ArsR/SmtB family transcription factor n=1 Tax=Desulfuromonas sp. DDH964 TaxID=1823759 RepID=UPI00078E7775|nr:metalloregulator ArsR/SmtB family transcription factor [Desulfuromonas sp. DDH964]AMV70660.1 ArsR family transcriptional regulator [Desulfuromonas sp. DDH964]
MKTQAKANAGEETCKVVCFNEELISEINDSMIAAEELRDLAEFYKLLGSPVRLKIIFALGKGELCVCDLAHILGLSMPATSQQLKLLRQQGILNHRNDGRMAYYSLAKPRLFEVIQGDVAFVAK